MNKVFIIFLAVIILIMPSLSLGADSEQFKRKDPILAGALSWHVPGLGQFYAGSFLKGAAFWLIEEVLLMSTILTLGELELNVTGDVGLGLNIISKENPDTTERRTALILGSSLIVVHFINIIDAVNTARNYNRIHQGKLVVDIQYDETNETYNLGFEGKF